MEGSNLSFLFAITAGIAIALILYLLDMLTRSLSSNQSSKTNIQSSNSSKQNEKGSSINQKSQQSPKKQATQSSPQKQESQQISTNQNPQQASVIQILEEPFKKTTQESIFEKQKVTNFEKELELFNPENPQRHKTLIFSLFYLIIGF
jgi:predicted small secreted protein